MIIAKYERINESLQNLLKKITIEIVNKQFKAIKLDHSLAPITITKIQSLHGLQFNDRIEEVLFETMIKYALYAETKAPGSFDLVLRFVRDEFLKSSDGELQEIKKNLHETASTVSCNRPSLNDVSWLLSEFITDINLKALLEDALILAGFAGRITIEKSSSSNQSIELVNGYTFPASSQVSLSGRKRINDVRIVLIDGYIESVSEIHSVLTQASESKQNTILIVRGMSDDVKNTLKINLDNGRLNVYPYVIHVDLEGVNMLNDIAAISNNDVISSLKGNLISAIKLNDCGNVKSSFISENNLTIINDSTISSVKAHVQSLIEKRNSVSEDINVELLNKRIRSLSSKNVIIRLTNDRDYVFKSQMIDHVLRAYSSLLDHGTMIINDKKYLTGSLIYAQLYFTKFKETILGLGSIIA